MQLPRLFQRARRARLDTMGEAVTLTACFKLEKETKNTDRYAE